MKPRFHPKVPKVPKVQTLDVSWDHPSLDRLRFFASQVCIVLEANLNHTYHTEIPLF